MKAGRLSVFLVVLVSWALCCGDTIILKEGQKLTGDILAEKETLIYVDIGIEVLKIPKEQILEYKYTEGPEAEAADANEVCDAGDTPAGRGQLYYSSSLEKTTIEKCVEAVSEAVVKVSSPAGMGSGFFINEQGYLITNYHVIEKETKLEVTVFEKETLNKQPLTI